MYALHIWESAEVMKLTTRGFNVNMFQLNTVDYAYIEPSFNELLALAILNMFPGLYQDEVGHKFAPIYKGHS